MSENELRAAFARHEAEAPDVYDLNISINQEVRRRRRRRTTMLSGALAAVVALVIAVPVWLTGRAHPASNPPASLQLAVPGQAMNILLLGTDNWETGEAGPARADAIMIAHVPADRSGVYLVSIERDVLVDIPGHGLQKINAAFAYGSENGGGRAGGAALAARVVSALSGVQQFDAVVTIDFPAVKKITDALGGVEVCLHQPLLVYRDVPQSTKAKATERTLAAGCLVRNGTDALDLIRQRYGLVNGAYDRDRNAQRFLAGVAKKVAGMNLLTDAPRIVALARTPGVSVDAGPTGLPELLLQLKGAKLANTVGLSLAGTYTPAHGYGYGEMIPEQGKQLLAALAAGSLPAFVAAHPGMALTD